MVFNTFRTALYFNAQFQLTFLLAHLIQFEFAAKTKLGLLGPLVPNITLRPNVLNLEVTVLTQTRLELKDLECKS